MSKNAVVIPIYTLKLSADELLSLRQCRKVLAKHDIIVVHPEGLDLTPLADILPGMQTEAFAPEYFKGIKGYNRLMLSPCFYDRFAGRYGHILIYQTDAWVFEDRLDEWAVRGYDYIGAPWIPRHRGCASLLALRKMYARATGHSMGALRQWRAGNGGFSLRRPDLFARLLREHPEATTVTDNGLNGNEDVVWSVVLGKYLSIPSWQEAIDFAIEKEPEWAIKRLGHMPFGCHGWNKAPYDAFWKPLIKNQ